MKKLFVALLLIVLVLSASFAFAETKTFSLSMVENLPGYEFDKMDKDWTAYAAYIKKFSDANVVFGIHLEGEKELIEFPPYFYCWVRNKSNSEVLYKITKVKLLIGDTLYSADALPLDDSSLIVISENSKPVIEAIANCDEMLIRLIWNTASIDLELDKTDDDFIEIRKFCKELIKKDIWSYYDSAVIEKYNDYPHFEEE